MKELKKESQNEKRKRIAFAKTVKEPLFAELKELADEKSLSMSGIIFLLAGERLTQLKREKLS